MDLMKALRGGKQAINEVLTVPFSGRGHKERVMFFLLSQVPGLVSCFIW